MSLIDLSKESGALSHIVWRSKFCIVRDMLQWPERTCLTLSQFVTSFGRICPQQVSTPECSMRNRYRRLTCDAHYLIWETKQIIVWVIKSYLKYFNPTLVKVSYYVKIIGIFPVRMLLPGLVIRINRAKIIVVSAMMITLSREGTGISTTHFILLTIRIYRHRNNFMKLDTH